LSDHSYKSAGDSAMSERSPADPWFCAVVRDLACARRAERWGGANFTKAEMRALAALHRARANYEMVSRAHASIGGSDAQPR